MLGRGGGGGEDSESLGRIMAGMPLQLGPDMAGIHARLGLPQPQPRKGEDSSIKVPGGMANPQWNHSETRDLISIRAVLERDASLSKRNKTLWEAVAARMRDHGHRRTPEQCKCKWKNLVNRYKVFFVPDLILVIVVMLVIVWLCLKFECAVLVYARRFGFSRLRQLSDCDRSVVVDLSSCGDLIAPEIDASGTL